MVIEREDRGQKFNDLVYLDLELGDWVLREITFKVGVTAASATTLVAEGPLWPLH